MAVIKVSVVQPLQVVSRDASYGSKVVLSVSVCNSDPSLSVELQDLEVHLNRTRYMLEGISAELATVPLEHFFQLSFDKVS